jgi:hypothetical protein
MLIAWPGHRQLIQEVCIGLVQTARWLDAGHFDRS